jgi:putative ABC transport system substrate-binding protein
MKKRSGMIIALLGIVGVLVAALLLTNTEENEATDQTETTDPSTEETFRIGILQTTSHPSLDEIREGTIEGLAEQGYIEGDNIEVIFQNAQGDQSLLNTMAGDMVESNLDLLIGIATPAQQALANATSEIPIVMGAVADPVGAGLVSSLDEPGGNVTGVQNRTPVEDQIELALDAFPEATRIGLLYSSGEDNAAYESQRATEVIESLGAEAVPYTVSNTNELQQMVGSMVTEVDLIYLPVDNTIASAFDVVVQEATQANIPLVPTVDLMIAQGGLLTVGINQFDMGVETGRLSAQLLEGADPATTPVFVMDQGEILVNPDQAETLGVNLPESIVEEAVLIHGAE